METSEVKRATRRPFSGGLEIEASWDAEMEGVPICLSLREDQEDPFRGLLDPVLEIDLLEVRFQAPGARVVLIFDADERGERRLVAQHEIEPSHPNPILRVTRDGATREAKWSLPPIGDGRGAGR